MCELADFADLELTPLCRRWLEDELESWHRDYLPVAGTVLDVGAGSGETARFYLLHGADRVICIERYRPAFEMLCRNFAGDPRVTAIHADLSKIKVDVEGAEENMDLEIHFPYRWVDNTTRDEGEITQLRLVRCP